MVRLYGVCLFRAVIQSRSPDEVWRLRRQGRVAVSDAPGLLNPVNVIGFVSEVPDRGLARFRAHKFSCLSCDARPRLVGAP